MENEAKKQKINLPTKITIARIAIALLMIIAIIVIYLLDQGGVFSVKDVGNITISSNGATINWIMLILLGVFLFASLTDFLDGYIARKYNMVTDLGKFLDPVADKMLINSMMIFLTLNFVSLNGDLKLPFFCVILMVIRDLIVDGLRFMAAKKNKVIAANIFGKLKTVSQMAAICFVLLNGFPFSYFDFTWFNYLHITDFLCYLTTFFSILSGIIYLYQNRKAIQEE